MTIRLKILPVFQGDAIIINCSEEDYTILVDTGTKRAYSRGILKSELDAIDKVDLLVVTHTDEDHIGGLIKYIEDDNRKPNLFKKIWFNTGNLIRKNLINADETLEESLIANPNDLDLSIKQGISIEQKLSQANLISAQIIKSGDEYRINNVVIKILSPNEEDLINFGLQWEIESNEDLLVSKSNDYTESIEVLSSVKYVENGTIANKSSIGFILSHGICTVLLMGDAYPSVIEQNLRILGYNEERKLRVDIVKVSHHGSTYGISPNLLNIIDCQKFVISTNASNGLPSKECLARIITHREEKVLLYFNYKNEIITNIFSEEDFENYNFEIAFLTAENDYTLIISGEN